jgi:hypothetical protein
LPGERFRPQSGHKETSHEGPLDTALQSSCYWFANKCFALVAGIVSACIILPKPQQHLVGMRDAMDFLRYST